MRNIHNLSNFLLLENFRKGQKPLRMKTSELISMEDEVKKPLEEYKIRDNIIKNGQIFYKILDKKTQQQYIYFNGNLIGLLNFIKFNKHLIKGVNVLVNVGFLGATNLTWNLTSGKYFYNENEKDKTLIHTEYKNNIHNKYITNLYLNEFGEKRIITYNDVKKNNKGKNISFTLNKDANSPVNYNSINLKDNETTSTIGIKKDGTIKK